MSTATPLASRKFLSRAERWCYGVAIIVIAASLGYSLRPYPAHDSSMPNAVASHHEPSEPAPHAMGHVSPIAPASDVTTPLAIRTSENPDIAEPAATLSAAQSRPIPTLPTSAPNQSRLVAAGYQQIGQTGETEPIIKDVVPLNDVPPTEREVSPPAPPEPTTGAPQLHVPLGGIGNRPSIQLGGTNGRLNLAAREAPLSTILAMIAEQHGLNVVTSGDVSGVITVTLRDVPLDEAFHAILAANGYTWYRHANVITVSPLAGTSTVSPHVSGRQLRFYRLNYVSAKELERVVKGFLSPSGQAFMIEASPSDKRKTQEQLVVEDFPEYLHRVDDYIAQVDQPPRQVLVEAHILEVELSDEMRHGVNWNFIADLANTELSLRTTGMASSNASPGFFLGIDGTDVNGLLECLKSLNQAKTLASPKLLVVNGQEAKIQIGAQLGYFVATATETSTIQNVEFLDVGIVLRVTPQIAEDNHVLMHVKPEISSGQINPDTGLPEEETTEVETSILVPDGQGIVIGGLIKEATADNENRVPWLGNLWLIGKLFRRTSAQRERSELIVVLVPRVAPYPQEIQWREQLQMERAMMPLMSPCLVPHARPQEPNIIGERSYPLRGPANRQVAPSPEAVLLPPATVQPLPEFRPEPVHAQ